MCTNVIFWSTATTLDFGTKSSQNHMNDKTFEKIIKITITLQQCTPAPNFSQFRELQSLNPNLPKKYE